MNSKQYNKLVSWEKERKILNTRKALAMTRTFFTESRAKAFAESLEKQGFESVKIWSWRDGFGQTVYTVKWF